MNLSGININEYSKVEGHMANCIKNYNAAVKQASDSMANIPDFQINQISESALFKNQLLEDYLEDSVKTFSAVESNPISELYETFTIQANLINEYNSAFLKIFESSKETLSFRENLLERIKNNLRETSYVSGRFVEASPTNKILKKASNDQVSEFIDKYYDLDNELSNDVLDFMVKSLTAGLLEGSDFEYRSLYDAYHTKFEVSELKPCDIETLFLEFRKRINGIQHGIALKILFILEKHNLSRIIKRIKLSYFECPLVLSKYEFFDLIFSFKENVIQAVNQLHNHILLIFKFIKNERKRNYRFIRIPC